MSANGKKQAQRPTKNGCGPKPSENELLGSDTDPVSPHAQISETQARALLGELPFNKSPPPVQNTATVPLLPGFNA